MMDHLDRKIKRYLDNMNNDTDVTEDDVIEQLNHEEVLLQTPLLVYLFLILITGILGNGLVCYIYRTQYHMSSSRWFIFFLGTVDLIICSIVIPCEVVTTFQQYNFKNVIFCKVSMVLNTWSLLSLGFTLVIVSIDRYRKVCKPLGLQINFEKGKVLCAGAILVAGFLALPVFAVYGIHNIEFDTYNITAYKCSFSKDSHFAFWYILFGVGLFIGALITVCVLYCFIGYVIKQQINRKNMKRQVSLSVSMAPRTSINTLSKATGNQHETKIVLFKTTEPEVKSVKFAQPQRCAIISSNDTDEHSINNMSDEGMEDFKFPVMPRKPEKTKSHRGRSARARKATFSMFLITLAFVISYLPFLCLLMARTWNKDFEETLSDTGRAVYKFFLRSFFFNCAINPFIYGMSDSRFRDSCKAIIQAIFGNCVRHFRNLMCSSKGKCNLEKVRPSVVEVKQLT